MSREKLRNKIGHYADVLDKYVKTGDFGGGHFLSAVLENNLLGVFSHADTFGLSILQDLVTYLYNYCPAGCWGSRKKIDEWKAVGGLKGLEKKRLEESKE